MGNAMSAIPTSEIEAAAVDAASVNLERSHAITRHCKYFKDTTRLARPLFYFIGSAVSAMGHTGLPSWNDYVNGLMTGLGRCAGLRDEDVGLLAQFEHYRNMIKSELARAQSLDPDHQHRPSYLENYHMTDVLSRRLGQGYLKVLEVFQGARYNSHHKNLVDDMIGGDNAAMGIITTNFDTCIDSYLSQLLYEEKIQLCKMSGVLHDDLKLLDAVNTALGSRPIVLLCQSLQSFDLVSSLMYHFVEKGSNFRFVFNIHGTAIDTITCIDSNFQREQRLPYGVSQALYCLYIKCNFIVAGYSGLDLKGNLDYLRMLSNWEHIDAVWLIKDMNDLGDRDNFPPRKVREEMEQCRARYRPDRGHIEFMVEDLRLASDPDRRGNEEEIETRFKVLLDSSIAQACSHRPIWAALALQDLIRALTNEANRREILALDSAIINRNSQSIAIEASPLVSIREELANLQRGISHRLAVLTMRRQAAQADDDDSESVQREWTEGWLMNNFQDPDDIPGLGEMVKSLFEIFHRMKRNLEPSEYHRRRLNDLAILMETTPERFTDAWVVWATYIMLNYHDPDRKRLCWSYYLKAVRSALHTGNVWGKQAIDHFQEKYWRALIEDHCGLDDRTALRFYRKPSAFTKEYVDNTMATLRRRFKPLHLALLKKQKFRDVMSAIHVLGIDPDLPVHHHAQIPLPEYFRVLLIVALLFSKSALMRESEGRGNYTFLKNTLEEAERKMDLFPAQSNNPTDALNEEQSSIRYMPGSDRDQITASHAILSCLWLVKEKDNTRTKRLGKEDPTCHAPGCQIKSQAKSTNLDIEDQKIRLLNALKRLVDNKKAESLLAKTMIADFLMVGRDNQAGTSDHDTHRQEHERRIEEVMEQLCSFAESFYSNGEGVPFSRDLLYDIFHLSGQRVVKLSEEQEGRLVNEKLKKWIKSTYGRRPWKYQDILQLIINSVFALHRPVLSALKGSKSEAVLVVNEYEIQLFSLGILAHTTNLQRQNLELKVHMLNGGWNDYQCFALADIARLRHDDSLKGTFVTGEAEVMEYLKKRQLNGTKWNDSSLHARSKQINTTCRSETNAEMFEETRRRIAERLAEEFVICSERPLPSVYSAPEFKAYIFKLVVVKVADM